MEKKMCSECPQTTSLRIFGTSKFFMGTSGEIPETHERISIPLEDPVVSLELIHGLVFGGQDASWVDNVRRYLEEPLIFWASLEDSNISN